MKKQVSTTLMKPKKGNNKLIPLNDNEDGVINSTIPSSDAYSRVYSPGDSSSESLISEVSSEQLTPEVRLEEGQETIDPAVTRASSPPQASYSCGVKGLWTSEARIASKSTQVDSLKADVFPDSASLKTFQLSPLVIETGEVKRYPCRYCSFVGRLRKDLREHMKSHDEHPFKCQSCGDIFYSKGSLQRHTLLHTREQPFKCHLCDKGFNTTTLLKVHFLKHTGERPYKCDQCSANFTQLSHLKKHLGNHVEREYSCLYCEFISKGASDFKKHVKLHGCKLKVQCDKCDYSCEQGSQMRQHLLKHTEDRPFTCTYCGSGFKSSHHLGRHITIHSEERRHKCPHCDYASKQSSHLNKHILTHSQEHIFCLVCDFKCVSRESLGKHMQKHSVERVYSPYFSD